MNKKRSQELTRSVTLGVLTRFVVACILFTLASVLLLFFGMFVCYLIPWNGGPLYNFLITIRNNVIFFMIVYLIFGYIVIFLIFWAKTLGYLADLVRATELIYKGGDRPIELPSALHDLARAVKYINDNAKALNVIAGSYAVCGFSAGGTLAAQWGTDNKGYARYGLPKPAALFPIYPVLCLPEFYSKLRFKAYFARAFGPDPLPTTFDDYDLTRHMTVYPPAFMVIGRRDGLISYKPVAAFADLLLKRGVPAYADICPSSPHGFGDGEGRGAQGWILRADAFLKNGKV